MILRTINKDCLLLAMFYNLLEINNPHIEKNKCNENHVVSTLHSSLSTRLLGPAVVTVGVGADIVQSHLRLRLLGVGLEKYGLSVAAFGTGMVLGSG